MDCVIPPHGVRTFSAAVACLGKVGKELYVDFCPLDGLTLRTLNDAKSAYAAFRFAPSFFERCAAPPPPPPGSSARAAANRRGRGSSSSTGVTGRKRDRSRSESRTRRRRRRRPEREESDGGGEGRPGVDDDSNGEEGEDEEEDDGRYMCRAPVRNIHAVLRPRKGVVSLRVRSKGGYESANASPASSQMSGSRGVGDDDGDGCDCHVLPPRRRRRCGGGLDRQRTPQCSQRDRP
uniref:Uncharacterized protein n=1 Tax=Odontella aurita TaxID=265563 RepID=A0A7S4JA65_9STRA|mmetsp:Transcript_42397/g.128617  ORF Transcript_42397/g.128617 Transcript_42397/m.128617 type:complete len:235 (+) Transcript_42397:52-756(+)